MIKSGRYYILKIVEAENSNFSSEYKCDVCNGEFNKKFWYYVEPSITPERNSNDILGGATCSKTCANMWVLQQI